MKKSTEMFAKLLATMCGTPVSVAILLSAACAFLIGAAFKFVVGQK